MTVPPPEKHPILPPENHGSPGQVEGAEGEVPFYLPEWGATLRLMRWKVLLFLPAGLFLIPLGYACFYPWLFLQLLGWWKLIFIAVALPLGVAVRAAREGIRNRTDAFCIHCGYSLTGLPDGHNCPECGRTFSHAVINEYRRDPHWFIERHKLHKNVPVADVPFEVGAGRGRRKSRDGT